MNIETARALIALAGENTSVLGYSGRFPDEHSARLVELGELSRPALVSKGRTGYLMVEAYQNIIRHQDGPHPDDPWGPGRSLFLYHSEKEGQRLFTQNVVTNRQADHLQEIFKALLGKDAAGLKRLFMEGLQRSSSPGQRGAGLGLIEMVRRTGHPPSWSFSPLDDGHQVFSFTLQLGATLAGHEAEIGSLILQHRLELVHVGQWSAELGRTLIAMAQAEIPPRPGRSADRESVWGLVSSVILPFLAEHPVLFTLHNPGHPMLSVGGTMTVQQAGGCHAAMQGTDVEFSFGDVPVEGHVLALVHLPW